MDQSTISKPLSRAQSSILSFLQPRSSTHTEPSTENLDGVSIERPDLSFESLPLPALLNLPSTATLPSQATISPIYETHIQALRRINTLLLPINYPDSFYRKILDPSSFPSFSRVILWSDAISKSNFASAAEPKVIGGIVCRLEQYDSSQTSAIYIQSLALLSPYRSYGLATAALIAVIQSVVSASQTTFPITSVYAHVWSENKDGLEWYSARGFEREEPMIDGYYHRLMPNTAWILRKSISPKDRLQYKQSSATTSTRSQKTSCVDAALDYFSAKPSPHVIPSPSPDPTQPGRGTSYQTTGPGHEWNDLPHDILRPSISNPSLHQDTHLKTPSPANSAATSRSSSRAPAGGKKKRAYPAAAFNGGSVS